MLGEHDGVDLAHGIFHRVVDDKVIVGVGSLKLDLGADEALLDLLGLSVPRPVRRCPARPTREGR